MTTISSHDLCAFQSVLEYDRQLLNYYSNPADRGTTKSAPLKPTTYDFYKTTYMMTKTYGGLSTLELSQPEHQHHLARMVETRQSPDFKACDPRIAGFVLTYDFDPNKIPSFIQCVNTFTLEPSHPAAQALYGSLAIHDVLSIPTLPAPQADMLIAAMDALLSPYVLDEPIQQKKQTIPEVFSDQEQLEQWIHQSLTDLYQETGRLWETLSLMPGRDVSQAHHTEQNLISSTLVTQQRALLDMQETQKMRATQQQHEAVIKQRNQTLQSGVQFISSVAQLSGHPKLAQEISVVGHAGIQIYGALSTLSQLPIGASLLTCLSPTLALANGLLSLEGLFTKKKNSSQKAMKALSRTVQSLVEKTVHISRQVQQLHQEMLIQHEELIHLFSTLQTFVETGFTQMEEHFQTLKGLSHTLSHQIERLSLQHQHDHHELTHEKQRDIQAFLNTCVPQTSSADHRFYLQKAYQWALLDAKLPSMAARPVSIEQVSSPFSCIQTLAELLPMPLPTLPNPDEFYSGVKAYHTLLETSFGNVQDFSFQQAARDIAKTWQELQAFQTTCHSPEARLFYQTVLADCQQLIEEFETALKTHEHAYLDMHFIPQAQGYLEHCHSQIAPSFTALAQYLAQQRILVNRKTSIPLSSALCASQVIQQDMPIQIARFTHIKNQIIGQLSTLIEDPLCIDRMAPAEFECHKTYLTDIHTVMGGVVGPAQSTVHLHFYLKSHLTTLLNMSRENAKGYAQKIVWDHLQQPGAALSSKLSILQEKTAQLDAFMFFANYAAHQNTTDFPSLALLRSTHCPWRLDNLQKAMSHPSSPPMLSALFEHWRKNIIPAISNDMTDAFSPCATHTPPPCMQNTASYVLDILHATQMLEQRAQSSLQTQQNKHEKYHRQLSQIFEDFTHYIDQLPQHTQSLFSTTKINELMTIARRTQDLLDQSDLSVKSMRRVHQWLQQISLLMITLTCEPSMDFATLRCAKSIFKRHEKQLDTLKGKLKALLAIETSLSTTQPCANTPFWSSGGPHSFSQRASPFTHFIQGYTVNA